MKMVYTFIIAYQQVFKDLSYCIQINIELSESVSAWCIDHINA